MLKLHNMETFRIEGKVFERLGKIVPPHYKRRLVSEFGTIAGNFSKERFIKKELERPSIRVLETKKKER